MKIISDLEQNTNAWLDWRRNHITATNASVIMKLNPFQTKLELWQEKTLGWEKPFTQKEIDRMAEGSRLEPIAREIFCAEIGAEFIPICGEHEEYNFLAASFDGMTVDYKHALEIKCGKKSFMLAQCDEIPPYYFAQIQHQMMISNLDSIFYYCFDGYNGITLEVARDDTFVQKMLEEEIVFWDLITSFIPPKD